MPVKVLWVDDEPQSLRFESKLANAHGWQITWAQTMSQAIDLVKDTDFALVVLDLILPLDDFSQQRGYLDPDAGIRLIKAIQDPDRVGCTLQNVPILVITATVSPAQKAAVIDRLPSERHYLTKPLEEGPFLQIVRELTRSLGSSALESDRYRSE